ncbi:MAG: ATP synthase subunit C [Gammaproteobacteria bacterium]|nr:ATP synthase subunit C [Gammaproteobacteria bacterium]
MNRPIKITAFVIVAAVLVSVAATGLLWLPAALAVAPSHTVALAPGVWQWGMVAAAAATGLSSLGAAYAVATVGSAAVGALAEKPELLGRVLILVGLAEGIAIYGLIVSILILNRLS